MCKSKTNTTVSTTINNSNSSLGSTIIEKFTKTNTAKEIDQTSSLLIRAIHAALSPLEKWVIQKEYNLEETKKLLVKKLHTTPIELIVTPPSYIAIPALQSISYCMDDEQLRDMYAELLAQSMNLNKIENVHPTFVEIIRQLSPFDATVFKELTKTLIQPCISIRYMNTKNLTTYPIMDIVAFTDINRFHLVQTQISLENLERLHLIEINKLSKCNNQNQYEELKDAIKFEVQKLVDNDKARFNMNEHQVVYDEFVILIRGFGQLFARACLGTDFSNIK